MQEIDFEDKKTSLSAATFSAFQRNVKKAFKNYKIGQLILNTDVIKNGSLSYVNLSKDENNTVNLSLCWNIDNNNPIAAGVDYFVAYLPQEFRPAQEFVYGGCRAEQPYGPASFVISANDGRIVLTASQVSKKLAMNCSYKAMGGTEV